MVYTKVPTGKLTRMSYGDETMDHYFVDSDNNVWILRGICILCDQQILRLLQATSMTSLIAKSEEELMWGKLPNTACNPCGNKLALLANNWENYLN